MTLRRSIGALCVAAPRYIRLFKQSSLSIPIPVLPKKNPPRPKAVHDSDSSDVARISEILFKHGLGSGSELEKALASAKINPSPNLLLRLLNQSGYFSKPLLTLLTWLQTRPDYEFSMKVFNAMIDSLGNAREFETAWRIILDHLQEDPNRRPNFDTFAIMIRRYTPVGLYQEAIRTFEYACNLDLFKDLDSRNKLLEVLLDSLCQQGHVQIASQYVVMQRAKTPSFSPSIHTYEILLNGWFLSRKLENAEHLWMQMKEENVKPTVVTYGILIEGLCRMNQLENALEIIEYIRKEGLELNAMIYNPIIDCLGEAQRFKEALGMLERFSILELGPTIFTYNSLVKSFCNAGDLIGGCKIIRMMITNKCLPSSVTYSYFLKHFLKESMADLSLNLYTKMIYLGYEPDSLTYHLMVKILCKEGNIELAKQIKKEMTAKGFDLDFAASIMLFKLLCRFHAYNDAVYEFEDMLNRGHIPHNQTYHLIKKELEKHKMTEVVNKLNDLMESAQQGSDDSSHERTSFVIQKAEAISDIVSKCRNPRVLIKRYGSRKHNSYREAY